MLLTLTAKEAYKAASAQQLLRLSNSNQVQSTSTPSTVFRLTASGIGMKNETAIYFQSGATNNYDTEYDAISLGVDPGFLGITSVWNDTVYAINGLPALTSNLSIPIKAITGTTGSYQITATDLQNLPSGACIKLHDNYLNVDQDLRTGPYNCTLNDTETVARFSLNITVDNSPSVSGSSQNPTCANSANGYMVASATSSAPWNYYWKDASNNIIRTTLNKTTADTFNNANAGSYHVDINTAGSCNNGTVAFTLQGTISPTALYSVPSASITLVNDTATVAFTNNSSNATAYLWDFGDETQATYTNITHQYTNAGIYVVTLAAVNQVCGDTSWYSQVITVDTASSTTGIKTFAANGNNVQISRDAAGYYVQFNYQDKINAVISVQNLLGEKVIADITQDGVSTNKTYIPLGNAGNNVLIISVVTTAGEKTFRKVINP